ncbi:hypothetical protein [Paenibacillus sp. UNC499MF]|uniref:hypothetical protein n=1 Tax=Paenibacillus sp. UNC499MF TaxID=1502751 RepID=UPI00089FC87A|nr:hypothetical protein [Paenibacillus sp. UNC499MF]SEG77130.1 hypothetical protein SAMN02799616_04965 [Paenibacillus sp. UNC499MF]
MLRYLRQGLTAALKQPFAVCVLYVYQFAWGILLYKWVQSIIVPLLHRYPAGDQPQSAVQLFVAESQFRLVKTDLIQPYLEWLIILLAVRMLISPMLNAGVLYSLEHRQMNAGYRFMKGIRELLLPFFLYYLLQTVLMLAPLYWLAPKALALFNEAYGYEQLLLSLLPWAALYAVYALLIQLLFLFLQFGRASEDRRGLLAVLPVVFRQGLRITCNALLLILLGFLLAVAATTASYVWAGLTALIIHQIYPLVRTFVKMWSIAAQREIWESYRT